MSKICPTISSERADSTWSNDVEQPEMALHEDAAATGWACQIGGSLMSLGVMSHHPAKEQGPNPRYPLFKHGITTEEYTYSR
jgi:hypothetical protein